MKRILTIDGGDIRCVFPVAFLAKLEQDVEYPIARYFDLISGTSTGGIIARASRKQRPDGISNPLDAVQ